MKLPGIWGYLLAGALAGAVTGLLGTGGGMVLVPALALFTGEEDVFSLSVAVILPVCLFCLWQAGLSTLPWRAAAPYMAGGALGGLAAGRWGQRVPRLWLHRIFGALALWGGVRYLW